MSDTPPSKRKIDRFRNTVYEYYRTQGRTDLPWRGVSDPYRIFVSEIMLQQTQVDRVGEKFGRFVERFPDFIALAGAPLRDVLAAWQGLGYNRRAVALKQAADKVVHEWRGSLPLDPDALATLPGIGRNTACAIIAYAFNQPVVYVETNIRTVFIHHFFEGRDTVPDREILALVEATLDREHPREWYSALMDYGTMLKKVHGSTNPRSAHYHKQSRFEGSNRQVRGRILRTLLGSPGCNAAELADRLETPAERVEENLAKLVEEGLVRESGGRYEIA
jgi:A/G-specific adenine glycosylase